MRAHGSWFRLAIVVIGLPLGCSCLRHPDAQLYSGIPILVYHRIGEASNDLWTIAPDDFERQMRALVAEGYQTILPVDLLAWRRGQVRLPSKPIMITFDDGYQSTLTVAEPILRECGFKAVLFITSSLISAGDTARQHFEGYPCLTREEVQTMATGGVFVIGSHAHRHIALDVLPDPRSDILQSVAELTRIIGAKPEDFSYPAGRYNRRVMRAVAEAGFRAAFTAAGKYVPRSRWRLRRFEIPRLIVFGGQHRFEVKSMSVAPGQTGITVQVAHYGIGIPVIPRLSWEGIEQEDGWLPMRVFTKENQCWSWRLSSEELRGKGDIRVEGWDGNRVFRLFSVSLHEE